MTVKKFNIRVYAIISNDKGEVLLARESFRGKNMIKFPGGGLELGEGIGNALDRELMEELGLGARKKELYFINEHFQLSAFSSEDQILSIYYRIDSKDLTSILPAKDFRRDGISFSWHSIDRGLESVMCMPIDKQVASKISSE